MARQARHTELNKRVAAALRNAACPVELEPPGLSATSGKRPDGSTLLPFERGLSLAWDVTVPHPLAPSWRARSAAVTGAVALEAEGRKADKYSFLSGKAAFYPFAVETLGEFGPAARELVNKIVTRSKCCGAKVSRAGLTRSFLAAVIEGNAAIVLGLYQQSGATDIISTTAAQRRGQTGSFSDARRPTEGPPPA